MANTFHLTVRTPESEIIAREVNSLKVTTEGGEIEIYPHHASLTGAISISKLFVRAENEEKEYLVKRGITFVSVENNRVQILCFSCQPIQDVEYKSAQEYLQIIEEKLKAGEDLNELQIKYLENEKIAMVRQLEMLKEEK